MMAQCLANPQWRSLAFVAAFGIAATGIVAAAEPAAGPTALGVISEFPDWVTSLEFSPDGSLLAAGSYDEVRVIDPTTYKTVETLKTRNGYVRGLAFSPDGSQLAVGDYQNFALWDAKTARRVKTLHGHTDYVTAVVFAGDRLVSGSEDGTLREWNTISGDLVRTIDVGVPVHDVAVSPDGQLLAIAAGDETRPNRPGPVMLWSLRTGKKIADLIGHERAALAVAFNSDGTQLASAGEDEKVNLHDVPSGKAIGYYAGHSRSVNDVAFLGDCNELASVSGGNAGGLCELRIWKPDGSTITAVEPHEQRITSLAVAKDGKALALGSLDETVSLWDVSPIIKCASNGEVPSPVEAPRP